jgi:hypothetical protein
LGLADGHAEHDAQQQSILLTLAQLVGAQPGRDERDLPRVGQIVFVGDAVANGSDFQPPERTSRRRCAAARPIAAPIATSIPSAVAVPVAITVPTPIPIPIPVAVPIPIPVAVPITVPIAVPITVPIAVPITVPIPIPIPISVTVLLA